MLVAESTSSDGFVSVERSVNIQLVPLTEILFDFLYHVTVLDQEGIEVFVSEFYEHSAGSVQVGKALDANIKVEKLRDDELNLQFVIIKRDGEPMEDPNDSILPKKRKLGDDAICLLTDYKRLYNEMEDYDIYLIADGDVIPAHKLVLTTRSKVFKKKLQGCRGPSLSSTMNGLESANDSSMVKDIDQFDFDVAYSPLVVQEFLRFMYYSEVEFTKLAKGYHTLELFKMAEEFDVGGLEKLCLNHLTEAVHAMFQDDIVEVMELAYAKKLDKLFEICVVIFFR